MKKSGRTKFAASHPPRQRNPFLNLALSLLILGVATGLLQLGLLEGRADPSAPFLFDSADLQTLLASTFIGFAVLFFISGFRLGWFSLKLTADVMVGPALLVGYVTTRESESWSHRFKGEQFSYRVYLVSRQAFPLWLRGLTRTDVDEVTSELFYVSYRPRRLPAIVPRVFEVPGWAYEMVREGDLVRLHYARWQRTVVNVEVIESVLPPLPAPQSPSFNSAVPQIEADAAEWRVIEANENS